MKKILLFTSIFFFAFGSLKTVSAQTPTIDSVHIDQIILCDGDYATVTCWIDNYHILTLGDTIQYRNYRYTSLTDLVSEGVSDTATTDTSWQFTNLGGNANFIVGGDKRVLLVDSADFALATASMNNQQRSAYILANTDPNWDPNDNTNNVATYPILHFFDYKIYDVSLLEVTASSLASNLCQGDCDAEEFLFVSGGTPSYTLNVDDGVSYSFTKGLDADDTTLTNLCGAVNPGITYNISVTDEHGCNASGSFTIIDPDTLLPTGWVDTLTHAGFQDISCYGESDGVIVPQATGGTTPFIRYEIISPPPFPLWPYTPSGSPFDTIFSAPAPTEITGLDTGSYYIYYIDDNDCDTFQVLTLTYPDSLSGTVATLTDVTCNGYSDGVIEFTVDVLGPGTPFLGNLYDYSIDSGLTFPFQNISPYTWPNGLAAGWYYTVIRDANGCEFYDSVFVDEPTAIVWNAVAQDYNGYQVSCWRDTNGIITIDPALGGALGYTYSIDGGVTWTSIISPTPFIDLDTGTYVVIVRDANLCTDTILVPVNEPDTFFIASAVTSLYNGFNVSCPDACDGDVNVTPTNGVGTINYTLNALLPQTSITWIAAACGDTNTFFAIDVNGCEARDTIVLTKAPPWAYTVDSTNETCYNGNGSASITVTGGLPGNYSYAWACIPVACGFPPGGNFPLATNLDSGMYQVTVTDDNSCKLIEDILVGESNLILTFDSIIPPCNNLLNGTATVTPSLIDVTTGQPLTVTQCTYQWYSDQALMNQIPGQTDSTLTGQAPGTYWVEVIQLSPLCQANASVIIDPTNVVDVLQPLTGNMDIACFGDTSTGVAAYGVGGAVDITLGPAGYTYVWTNDPLTGTSTDTIDITQIATHLVAGNYMVSATDTNGCSSLVPYSFTINEPATAVSVTFPLPIGVYCHGDSTGTAFAIGTGGTPFVYTSSQNALDVLWSDPYAQTSANANTSSTSTTVNSAAFFLPSNWYTVTVTDSNNCSVVDSVLVPEPVALAASYTQDSAWCVGGLDGWAEVIPTGGIAPYEYLWDNAMTTDSAYNLAAGWHTVTITDNQFPVGCILIDSVLILGPSAPFMIDSLHITEITCHDADNASIYVKATGGGGYKPYVFSNDNGAITQSSTNAPQFNSASWDPLIPGTYIIYVRNAKGCEDTVWVDIVEPLPLIIDSVYQGNVTCYGGSDGYINNIFASGGTQFPVGLPYEYMVGNVGVSTGTYYPNYFNFNGYSANTYQVNIQDANLCATSYQITITQPNELDVTITPSNWNSTNYEIQCHGDSSGFAGITVAGGLTPYTYTALDINNNLDTIEGTVGLLPSIGLIDSLYAGTYTFTITDFEGCESEQTIIYHEPSSPISHNFITTHISCSGWSTGSLTDSVSGGNAPLGGTDYIYAWNTGDSTYSLTSLDTGAYIMTVVDLNGCESIDTATINYVDILTITATGTDVSCFDYCDGVITTAVTGGMPNINSSGLPVYTYLWNDTLLQTTATAVGLCVNNISDSTTYSCVVTDQQGCTDTVSYTLYQPDMPVSVTASILSQITCFGRSDGSATASPLGGWPPYSYGWSDGSALNPNTSLSVGNHVVTLSDSRGCEDTAQIYLTEPDALSITLSNEQDISCFGFDDGYIEADATGGTVINIQEYIYTWSNGFSEQAVVSYVDDFAPGIYTVTATDDNGCTITSESIYITEPSDPLEISVDPLPESCALNDGEANAFVLGGTPSFSYDWTGPNSFLATGKQITGLLPGLYNVNVTDANGCSIEGTTIVNGVRNIFYNPEYYASFDTTVCLGTEVFLDVVRVLNADGSPLTFEWENGSTQADRLVIPTNPVNVYTLSITDPKCVNPYTNTVTIIVESIDPLPSTNPAPVNGLSTTIVKGNSIEIFSNNLNCDTYEWSWIDDTVVTRVITVIPEASGWYYIEVNTAGCLGRDSVHVVVGVLPYDAITPNGDGFNDVWNVLDIESFSDAVVQIFNRWGALVYETSGGLNYVPWDGTRNGKELPLGTYYYIIDLNTDDEPQTGPITIIR